MSRRGWSLLGALVVVAGGCLAVMHLLQPAPRIDEGPKAPPVATREDASKEAAELESFERIVVTVELPARGEPLAWSGRGHGRNCPQTQVSALLGIVIANPHGVVVSEVIPDGPAAEAGILPGDGIVECGGVRVTCPSALLPHLSRTEEPRTVELTLRRRVESGKAAEEAEAADAESPPG